MKTYKPKSKLDAAYIELRAMKKVNNQADFGDELGYNKSYFSQLMNGAQPITEAIKNKCFNKFNIPLDWWAKSLDTPLGFTTSQQIKDAGDKALKHRPDTMDKLRTIIGKYFKKIPDPTPDDVRGMGEFEQQLQELERQKLELEKRQAEFEENMKRLNK